MNWKAATPPVNRHMALRLDDLNDINRDLIAASKELLELADRTSDQMAARRLSEDAGKLADLSRRLSLATRGIAHTHLAVLEAS